MRWPIFDNGAALRSNRIPCIADSVCIHFAYSSRQSLMDCVVNKELGAQLRIILYALPAHRRKDASSLA